MFDFDGVICASMAQHAEAYRRLLAPHGITVSDRDVYLLEGARSESIIVDLGDRHGIDLSDGAAALADEKQRIFRDLGMPALYPGAQEMVRAVQADHPTAVVTGTRRENLERLIPDLLPRFDAVLAQDAYTHDKPHPEPYANAAAALGVPAARCIALENAIRGVQSARAAGYGHVIAITTTLDASDLHEADTIIGEHGELAAVLEAQSL